MRKTFFTIFLFLLMVGFAGESYAQLTTIWEKGAKTLSKPAWFGADTERGFAFGNVDGNDRIYVVSRNVSPKIVIVDAMTGDSLGTLPIGTGIIAGGTFTLNDVEVSADGKIFAANLTTSLTTSALKVYRWDSETSDPVVAIEYLDAANASRLGDKFTVVGSTADNSIAIYFGAATSNKVFKFTTADNGATYTPEIITLSAPASIGSSPAVYPSPTGFWVNGNGVSLMEYDAAGLQLGTVPGGIIPTGSNAIRYFEDNSKKFLVVFQYGSTANNFKLIDVTAGAALADQVAFSSILGTATNANGTGDLGLKNNGDGSYDVYTLVTNNGLGKYKIWPENVNTGVVVSSYPYEIGFESGLVPGEGWSGNFWTRGAEPHSGSWSAKVSYNYSSIHEAILLSPRFDLPAGHRVRFWWKDDDITNKIIGQDTTFFEVSVNGGVTWTTLASLSAASSMSAYEEVTLDLSSYAGDGTYFRFRDKTNATSAAYGAGVDDFIVEAIPQSSMDWHNLQWPGDATITQGETVTVYTQGWEPGVTDSSQTAGAGIEVWVGLSTEDTDPSTWENWVVAVYNQDQGNNDEYMAELGDGLDAGTYYYASRWRLDNGPFTYGGYSVSGGGFWDGTNNVSGVLTVNPIMITSFPYTEGFEDGVVPPTGWSNPDGFWTRGTEAHSGSYAARAAYNHSAAIPAILTSPMIQLPQNYGIKFWWKDDDINSGKAAIDPDKEKWLADMGERGIEVAGHDTTYFEISTDGVAWTTLGFLSAPSNQSTYNEAYFDLASYGGQDIWVRWRDVTDASFSAWGIGLDDITIEENQALPPDCATNPVPADSATNVAVTAGVSWTAASGLPTGYKVYLDTNNPPTTMVYDGNNTSVNPDGNFAYSTEYFWQVVPYNASGDAVGCAVWSFTTEPDPTVMPPFGEDFSGATFPPLNWKRYTGYYGASITLTSSTLGWILDDFGNVTSPVNKSARNNIYGTTRNHWLMTPPIDLGDGSVAYDLDLDIALTQYSTTAPGVLGPDDKFAIVISTDGGTTWTSDNTLAYYDESTPISATGDHVKISLEGYTGVVMFGFYGESTVSNEDVNVYVDNVTVDEQSTAQEVTFNVMADWNMVSVPLVAEDMTKASLFPTATTDAFWFNNGYVSLDTLANGEGYWLKFAEAQQVTVTGQPPMADIPLMEGWNMVGIYDIDVNVADLVTNPPGIVTSSFFGYDDGYYFADVLHPGMGYWVKTSAAGVFVNQVAKKGAVKAQSSIPQEWARINITDAAGKSMTLYFQGENAGANYDMPPAPPVGVFDVRFANNTFAADLASGPQEIQLSSVTYPVKVSVSGTDLRLRDRITGEIVNVMLTDGSEVTISDSRLSSIEVSVEVMPSQFELAQNYPNPFNPSTTIKFGLPEKSNVSLRVFNSLGEEIATIINKEMEAGYHQVNFNTASYGLSSGVYFYRLESGSFVSIKKMVLLK
ncbi:MAG: DUF4623 domain-containing protein [Ignavibacteriales bacterium]|nr:DUF4623 domain-containing protein [Ignavibacteriales bacterium]MCF8314687.1 DUF4623 domain-containing protein [Ignavibacteriales bacterium]MCF8436276.1 DUF4623 domain-containing protein [Ignavibacteriales bacterium]